MPELKRTFTGGRMEKDIDERILPNGQYREALNIGVATSEDSDVGAAQNILGNVKVTSAASSTTYSKGGGFGDEHVGYNYHIAEIIDAQTDMLYRFVHTPNSSFGLWVDRIIEYDTSKDLKTSWEDKEHAIMVDVFKVTDTIVAHSCICLGSNKSEITVSLNKVNYLRWGMLVTVKPQLGHPGILASEGVTIENIDYQTGVLSLSKPVFVPNPPDCYDNTGVGDEITFTGDRNLNFSPDNAITGINIIDGMIFWTDNFSEPKKVNIKRGKIGSISNSERGFDDGTGIVHGFDIGRTSQDKIDDFNQPTLLIVDDGLKEDCLKDEAFCPIVGCTNPLAINYDPLALYDDNSCCLLVGCTDATLITDENDRKPGEDGYIDTHYCTYNPDNCYDDGSCFEDACGCTDSTAINFNAVSVVDDGSCIYTELGCTDDMAYNYDPNANTDDGSCQYGYTCYPPGYAPAAGDQCDDPNNLIAPNNYAGSTDIFDSNNWWSGTSGSEEVGLMNWFSGINNNTKEYSDYHYVWQYSIGAPQAQYVDTWCNYPIDASSHIEKRFIKGIHFKNNQFDGVFARVTNYQNIHTQAWLQTATGNNENTEQNFLGNPSTVSKEYAPQKTLQYYNGAVGVPPSPDPYDGLLTSPGADIVFANHTELVDGLRKTVFDGNYFCWANGSDYVTDWNNQNGANKIPVPEVTYSMTFDQIVAIVSPATPYFFGPTAGYLSMVLTMHTGGCRCYGNYNPSATSSCEVDPLSNTTLANCDANCGFIPA